MSWGNDGGVLVASDEFDVFFFPLVSAGVQRCCGEIAGAERR